MQHGVGDDEMLEVHRVEMTMYSDGGAGPWLKKRNTNLCEQHQVKLIEVYSPCPYSSVRVLNRLGFFPAKEKLETLYIRPIELRYKMWPR